jgi:hypothetical protein
VYLVGQRILVSWYERIGVRDGSVARRWLALAGMPVTFLLVLVTWVFFRAGSVAEAWDVLGAMAGAASSDSAPSLRLYDLAIVLASASLVFAEPLVAAQFERRGIEWWWHVPFWLRGSAYALGVLCLVAFGGPTQKFIYFDF